MLTISANAFGFIDESVMLLMLPAFGFAGLGAVRLFIEERGWKTLTSVVVGLVGIVALLFGWVTPLQAVNWFVTWAMVATASLTHAIAKVYLAQRVIKLNK